MGSKLSIFLVFVITFIGVAGAVYFLNQKYNNIFVGDFRPAPNMKDINTDLEERVDSLDQYYVRTKIDTFFIYQDTTLISQLEDAQKLIADLQNQIVEKEKTIKNIEGKISAVTEKTTTNQDSVKQAWLTATVKLIETMDAKRAARIIENYNTDLARDIIYKMKKKKAGEILSQLKPDLVTNLTGEKL
ncbi:MAG: MotE family protein [Rhodothermaceae bacterium]